MMPFRRWFWTAWYKWRSPDYWQYDVGHKMCPHDGEIWEDHIQLICASCGAVLGVKFPPSWSE